MDQSTVKSEPETQSPKITQKRPRTEDGTTDIPLTPRSGKRARKSLAASDPSQRTITQFFPSTPKRGQPGERSVTVTVKEEERTENTPTPDPTYSSQAHINDLPLDLLRTVLAYLPVCQLYRHGSAVCKKWRTAIVCPQFLAWRKRYVRYQQQEHDVVEEVKSLLQQNHIVKENKQFLLNMVRFLSSQAVTPGSVCLQQVLVCVSGHRLYSQAEACIRHRIPDLLGTDGAPNPWSVIVLLLVLAGGVRDVLDLVVRLQWSGCPLNHAQVTELLWATATLLLAMTHSDCPVGNRLHYDVFYVLQLMENAPPRQTDENVSDLQMSQEQQHILNHDVQSDHVVKIMAFAGTGKTSTLLRYAQRRPKLHLLYVAFNKSVAEQARRTFPKNVHCRTIHSLAHESVGHRYQKAKKLRTRQKAYFVARVLPKGHGGFVNAKVVIRTIDMFCASVDQVIGVEHVPKEYKNTTGLMKTPTEAEKEKFVEIAKELWDKMVSLESVEDDTDAFYMTTDGYLKLWQLQKPQLENYDIILIDEAQDCTPAIMDIILSQRCGKILVGDPHQQIYTFRGAVNALYTVPHTHIYYLTQSFRFGSEIAYTGATILSFCKGVTKNLIGGSQGGSVRGENSSVLTGLKSGLGQGEGKVAVLCRKNITVFIQAATLVEANPDCRIYLIGGVADFALPKIMDVWRLMQPEYEVRKEIKDPFIKRFVREGGGDYESFRGYVTLSEDLELEYHLSVVEKYKQRIPHLIERIRNSAQRTQRQRHKADFILGTLHKSKGMEFDTVVIADDFSIVNMALQTSPRTVPDDEWNLLYMAVSRAKTTLFLSKTIIHILKLSKENFLRSELTSALIKEGPFLPCSTPSCPYHIQPEHVLTTCKLRVTYIVNEEDGLEGKSSPGHGAVCLVCEKTHSGPLAYLLPRPT